VEAARKFLQTGWNENRRSAIVKTVILKPYERSVNLVEAIEVDGLLPVPPDSSRAQFIDLKEYGIHCPSGSVLWTVFSQAPGEEFPLHYTATLDFNLVVAGSTTLILEEGEAHLDAGDCVLVNGLPHGWRAGPQGCELSNVLVGKARVGSSS
jgi:hypothetical protein